jgi:signal transduction histidine kinase
MQIVNCTTPANFYHALRRQLKREYRKPLIVFTPKSLLRHPKCVSSISDLADGKFEGIIDDTIATKSVDKLVLCSGKIYYELLDRIYMQEAFYIDQSYIRTNPDSYKLTMPILMNDEISGFVIFERIIIEDSGAQENIAKILYLSMIALMILIIVLTIYNQFHVENRELENLESGLVEISKGILKEKEIPRDNTYRGIYQTYNMLIEELTYLMEQQHFYEGQRKSFLTMISHELKTPIATINAYIEGLNSGVAKDEDTRIRYQRIIEEKMQQLMKQVDDFFKYAQEDEGRFKYHFEECYADDAIGKIFEQMIGAEGKEAIVENHIPSCIISIDKTRIEQVIMNIFNNANKHTTNDDTIILRGYREDSDIVIEIIDSGDGINPRDLPYIFDYYYQGQNSKDSDYEGVGLGLAICKDIISHHKGSIKVKSSIGIGTTFYLKIPVV